MHPVYDFHLGDSPLLISIPHAGILVPDEILNRFGKEAKTLLDTDWYVDQLYDFAKTMDVSILKANYSRYVIDLNRSLDHKPLYQGADETNLCPLTTFKHENIYINDGGPDQSEIQDRVDQYWQPYHTKIENELARIKKQYGYALLWDAHSIKSQVPRFFTGRLPDFNLGTNGGMSCHHRLSEQLYQFLKSKPDYTSALNDRFKGGYITRQYGQPHSDIHAVQLELSQMTYMDEETLRLSPQKIESVRSVIRSLLEIMLNFSM